MLVRAQAMPSPPTADLLPALASEPGRAAILLDVDGTLAPIVDLPSDAAVPDETRAELRRLHGRYALVACVSGRPSENAASVVGVPELVYVGEHGLELDPEAPSWRARLHGFAGTVAWDDIEPKPLSVSFHYRRAGDEDEAVRLLDAVATRARAEGLVPRWGRKVLELRPPLAADKGTAVRRLLGDRGLRRALYAGDDATDLDAFRGLDGLDLGIRIAVTSAEGPTELAAWADVVVGGPAELLEILKTL
jgi:trehalose 6-phosphate phosphatase